MQLGSSPRLKAIETVLDNRRSSDGMPIPSLESVQHLAESKMRFESADRRFEGIMQRSGATSSSISPQNRNEDQIKRSASQDEKVVFNNTLNASKSRDSNEYFAGEKNG